MASRQFVNVNHHHLSWGVAGASSYPVKHYTERSIERVPVGFGVWEERPVAWSRVGAA